MRRLILSIMAFFYQKVVKPHFFRHDPEEVHNRMTARGERLGQSTMRKKLIAVVLANHDHALQQSMHGLTFNSPIGLAAGFDYEARLPQLLPALGFGFGSMGSFTLQPYEGNPRPMLGRLPKSRSLMVNKGFKNDGATAVAAKLTNQHFAIPVGISIGRTNGQMTQEESVRDITQSFTIMEAAPLHHAYYELNISCPNLSGDVTFYEPSKLEELLHAVRQLNMKRPLFIKMPITLSDAETDALLQVIVRYPVAGVILGNLQKDRKNPALHPDEVAKFSVGNFSGKPTEQRSNELIHQAYKKYGQQLTIIGCGGVFNAQDAYQKIVLGASLVQLITGMIFQGPQMIAQINAQLPVLLKRDGFTNLGQAIGSHA